MKFDVITIFPEIIEDYKKIGIIARGIKKKFIAIGAFDLRKFGIGPHRAVDDRPYGGGFGMVLKADIIQKALRKIAGGAAAGNAAGRKIAKQRIILLSPRGKVFKQADAKRLAKFERLIFVSGRYEGFDQRISQMVDEEFSIGDYVLMGGELPALVLIETIARFIPGVVGKAGSIESESFGDAGKYGHRALLEYPQYTRPEVLKIGKKNLRVPAVLRSGDHAKIEKWRYEQALKLTKKQRPDIL